MFVARKASDHILSFTCSYYLAQISSENVLQLSAVVYSCAFVAKDNLCSAFSADIRRLDELLSAMSPGNCPQQQIRHVAFEKIAPGVLCVRRSNMYEEDRESLFPNENTTVFGNPAGSEYMPGQQILGPNVLPSPTVSTKRRVFMATCRVCQAMIDISDKRDQPVVKCEQCNEGTPISNAPPDKKYVRCPCNCLLICKSSSQRIACPRPNCKRILNLTPSAVTSPVPTACHVTCAHCHNVFLAFTTCPYCGEVSPVAPDSLRGQGITFLMIGLVFLAIGIGVMIKRGRK